MTKTLAVLLLAASAASATEWHVLGPRPMAMGGAGVALPQGPQSSYWNPAGLGMEENPSGFQAPLGAHFGATGGVLRGANDLHQLSNDCSQGSARCTDTNIQNALNQLNRPDSGVRGDVGGSIGVKYGRGSFFANNLVYLGATPIIDTANNSAATVANNRSALRVRGISVMEYGFAYGRSFEFAPSLYFGGALKAMLGKTGFDQIGLVGTDPDDGLLDRFKNNSKTSFQPGVDLGVMWDAKKAFENVWWKPRVGLTARNVNNPKFSNSDVAKANGLGDKTALQGSARLGVAITPLNFWNVAADLDLTRNLTSVPGTRSQLMGVGTEFNVFNRSWINIPLRAGLSRNLADASARTSLSAGAGLHFLHVHLDLGVSASPARETIQSEGESKKIPNDALIGAQLAVLFGGPGDKK